MIAAILLLIVPHDNTRVVRFACVEVNHCFDAEGDLRFAQLVFRNAPGDEYVENWCFLNRHTSSYRAPTATWPKYDWERGCWRMTLIEDGEIVEVRTPSVVETWTQYDPAPMQPKSWRK